MEQIAVNRFRVKEPFANRVLLFLTSFCVIILTFVFQVHAKKRTVGDLLDKISSKSIKKQQAVIPSSQETRPTKMRRSQLRSFAPPKKMDTFFKPSDQDEKELVRLLDGEIKQLFRLMRRYQNSVNRGEIWLRLAERYMEKAKLLEFSLQTKFDQDLMKWKTQTNQKGRTPKLNLRPAQSYNRRAIKLYELFLENFPKNNKVDQALFFLGYNYFELNQAEKGQTYYDRLVREHKVSPYVDEAYFSLGEYHFEGARWDQAKTYFMRIIQKGQKGKFYHFSIYKMAWCEFNLGRGARGINYLEKVLMIAQAGRSSQDENFDHIQLKKEATNDLVVFYSKVKNYRGARAYFQDVLNGEDVDKNLEKLAYVYVDNGDQKAARFLFKLLIASNPEGKKAFEYQREIVNVYKGFTSPIFKAELFDWIAKYSKTSLWASANKGDKKLLKEADDSRESTLRNYILNVHQTAQKSNSAKNKKDAIAGYRIYLKHFVRHKESINMRFYFAELLYDVKRFEEASTHYLKVAEAKPKNEHSDDALMNAVLSLDQRLKKNKDRLSKGLKKVPYTKSEKRFLLITKKYLPQLKKAKPDRVVNIEFKTAHIMYIHNDFDKALPGLWNVINNYPQSEFVEPSAHLILDIHNLRKDYKKLIDSGTKLTKSPAIASKPRLKNELQSIVEQSQFQIAQDFEKKTDYQKSAEAYAGFAAKNANSSLFSVAVFNAAINFERSGDLLKAIKYHRHVLSRKDDKSKKNHQRSRRLVATLYEKTGQLKRAAVEFERYAKAYPQDQYVPESYYNAALIWRGFEQYDRAIQNFNAYYNLPSQRVEKSKRLAALVSIAEIHEKNKKQNRAYAYYEKYLKENPSDAKLVILVHIRLARIAQSLRWKKATNQWFTKVIAVQKAYPKIGKAEAAEAQFYLLQDTYREFLSIKIPADEAKQAAVINKKLALLKTLSADLAKVVLYDDPDHIVKAVALIGEANEHFATSVVNAPIPKGLSKEQAAEYRKTVDQKLAALPRQTAIDNYQLAIKRAYDLKAYNDSLKKALLRLSVMQPDRHFLVKEVPIRSVKLDLFGLKEDKKYAPMLSAIEDQNEVDLIDEAAKLLSKNTKDGVVLNGLAIFYLQNKQTDLARIYLGKAVETKLPKFVWQNNRGVASLIDNELKPAVDDFVEAAKGGKMSPAVSANLGYILLEYQDLVNAIRYLKVAAQAFPDDLGILNNYAITLKYAREYENSKDFYEKALAKDSSHLEIQLNYARLLVEEFADSNKTKAIEILNKVKFIGSDTQASNQADELLNQVRRQ